MTQGLLFETPGYKPPTQAQPVAPQRPQVDPVAVEAKRLSGHCLAILQLLQANRRVSNHQMAEISLKYTGRISDLRKAGHKVKLVERNHETGLNWYELEQ